MKSATFSGVMPCSLAEDILLSLLLRSELCSETLGSDLDRETGYHDLNFSWLFLVSPGNAGHYLEQVTATSLYIFSSSSFIIQPTLSYYEGTDRVVQ
jgi:hypothetical protein